MQPAAPSSGPQPKPWVLAVKAVILDAALRCLLIRRSPANRHFVGAWEWPGGKANPGEHFAAALIRECGEELGLEVEVTGLAGATEFEMVDVRVVLLCMEARTVGGTVRLSEEHDQTAWVSLAKLGCWKLTEQMKPFMLDYARRKLGTS